MEIARVRKLKYRLANDMLYRILNVSYIFKYDSKKHCSCDKFHGCPFINGEKSHKWRKKLLQNLPDNCKI